MFEAAELEHEVSKEDYRKEEAELRRALLAAQRELGQQRRFPVLILIAGVEGAGKSETVHLLNEWLDPRFIEVSGFGLPTEEEAVHPPMWRFWRALPPKGRIGIFFGAWQTVPILERVLGKLGPGGFATRMEEIMRLERMLAQEGVLLLKYWFHLSKAQQKKRIKSLEKDKETSWKVTRYDRTLFEHYDDFIEVCEPYLRETSTGEAPWTVVPAANERFRALFVGRHLLGALRARLDAPAPAAVKATPAPPAAPEQVNIIRALTLKQEMSRDDYDKELAEAQGRLARATRHKRYGSISVIAVFEGNDAAGKGGAVRRLGAALDPRAYRIVPVAAPTEEERAQPYLWRFWRHVPRPGRLTIFDRSWYGRVLVERVEGFAAEPDWRRAYAEINDFEEQLVTNGAVVAKFWLAISKDEQHRRFKDREATAFKRHKITEEDWRNREKWDAYEAAVCEMVERTSTGMAPWTLVEADNKLHARVKVIRTLAEMVEDGLKRAK
ncbi:polyphosphate:AMP phosphotransferase [Roseomonas eburnea]|uniref:Polyphosphate:AMP phosphotransferase n=1 Tax=Neoroseomonas eburnea TaxID=1346889 RepID=A0A9X9X6S3_9PROT|nr:polyphosphate:AMP phosphotransferase [Neoroseomonas eburnea]MBR0679409.1 polyphosphate:AMP phosphotransferase [Neoroseomonas eburnea]